MSLSSTAGLLEDFTVHELMLIPVSAITLPSRKRAANASIAAQAFVLPTSVAPTSTPHIYIDLLHEVGVPNFSAFELELLVGGDS
jgi:hypothetical protein